MREVLRKRAAAVLGAAAFVGLAAGSCNRTPPVPSPGSGTDFPKAVATFYTGLAALEVGDNNRANQVLGDFTKMAPGEPAGWANWGLFALRNGQLDPAAERIKKALELAPNDSKVHEFNAILLSRQGKSAEAIAEFRKSAELDPNNVRAMYALAQEVERQGGPNGDTEAQKAFEQILVKRPRNIVALLDVTRLAAKRGDPDTLKAKVAQIAQRKGDFPPDTRQYADALDKAANSGDLRTASTQVAFLQNTLRQSALYRTSFREVNADTGEVAKPMQRPLTLQIPPPTPAPPDTGVTFTPDPNKKPTGEKPETVKVALLAPELPAGLAQNFQASGVTAIAEAPPTTLKAYGGAVHFDGPTGNRSTATPLPFPGGPAKTPASQAGMLAVDLNYDFRNDLVFAGAGGLKLYQQSNRGVFADVTTKTGLPASVTGAPLFGVWALDVESDGDLDLIVAPLKGAPVALRNNADGTYKPLQPFSGLTDVRDFATADYDGDGDPDPALLDGSGKLHIFNNERSGNYRAREGAPGLGTFAAITVADVNRDGMLDFVLLDTTGAIFRLSDQDDGKYLNTEKIAQWVDPPALKAGGGRIFAADLDNSGSIDLLVSAGGKSQMFLGDVEPKLTAMPAPKDGNVFSVWDMDGDARLDVVGLAPTGEFLELLNHGSKQYHGQIVRPRATYVAPATDPAHAGDNRINPFGIGGEMEVRTALLAQKQPISAPTVHFGLGEHTAPDVVRIVWPNGAVNAEFPSSAPQAIVAIQRLTGSCPWLFAWNGTKVEFVTDFIWRSPLGLRINAQDTAGVMTTEDWVKIRGDQLAPRDGFYDLRITAELWETHFFDYIALMPVDHPAGTEMYIDERFAFPPDKFKVYITGPAKPVARAVEDNGMDVTDAIRERDGRYLDTFGRGRYQGVTRDHYLEVELPADAPKMGPLYLVCFGWIHPTDSSVNVAMSQGAHPKPQGIRVEVPDGQGGWAVAKPNIGFPSGKTKTILVPLEGLFKPGAPRRVRLRTNLEVYWDQVQVAAGLPNAEYKEQRILPSTAELRFRGYSATHTANSSSPELPDYDNIASTTQKWRDLIGFCTRFGDVRELMLKVDDRYAIVNAGDELVFKFREAAPPPVGWVRDYVFIGDGWEKDGNLNTGFSKTVLPLPSHTDAKYNRPPGRLEDDPVYKRYPRDWQVYHTRYVTPDRFRAMPGYQGAAE